MNLESWRISEKTIEKSKRYYAHFDYRTDIGKCWNYISDPQNICKHGFYPFIHYEKDMSKYSARDGKVNEKHRDICYAAHVDRCIFQLYNFMLNEYYNAECDKRGLGEVAVAYRTNFKKQNNIDFAYKAIQLIRESRDCYIMIGDFTSFFDKLDHEYLKKQWCSLLQAERLPKDHYAVFKNITRYSYVELSDLLSANGLENNSKGRRALNARKRALSPKELKERAVDIHKNQKCGIPQGSPMSGVLANIYMMEVDGVVHKYVSKYNGMYMRYSDDFIVVLPGIDEITAKSILEELSDMFNSANYPGLELQPKKTQYFHFHDKKIGDFKKVIDGCGDSGMGCCVNFLGFSFDGENVNLRAKTLSKYYQRLRRKAKTIVKSGGYTKKKKHISKKNLYMRYSVRGAAGGKGNFITYVNHAQEPHRFGEGERIAIVTKRNMPKIRSFLKKSY